MNIKNKIITVCHDAGGAEIISAFVLANREKYRFSCYVNGPAIKIFKRKKIKHHLVGSVDFSGVSNLINGADLLLTGTSWASKIELSFIRAAKLKGILSASFLDHWVNYKERFGFPDKKWKNNLPDEIWVGDNEAYLIAKKEFKGIKIKKILNPFFKEILSAYKIARAKFHGPGQALLFASEPLNAVTLHGGRMNISEEANCLELLLQALLEIGWKYKVIIRFHPSEPENKYKLQIENFSKLLKIKRSFGNSMYTDLAQSSIVVGMKSMFLVVATVCGKKVVSFLPGDKQNFILPRKTIIRINSYKKLKEWFESKIKP